MWSYHNHKPVLKSRTLKSSKKIIGELINHYRTKKGLTLEELATKMNTDRHYIWKIENGKVNMSMDYLDKIIKALKCTHDEFLR